MVAPEATAGEVAPEPPPAAPTPEAPPEASAEQRARAAALVPKTVVEAQPYRVTTTLPLSGGGSATLVDLAPQFHTWLLLTTARDGVAPATWHLENPRGPAQRVRLDPAGLVLTVDGVERRCSPWEGEPSPLTTARASGRSYAELCDGALLLRNPTVGARTSLEWTTDLLRDHVWGGEAITTAVKGLIGDGASAETSEIVPGRGVLPAHPGAPRGASIDPALRGSRIGRGSLGLPVEGGDDGDLAPGAWYPVHGAAGVWAGVVQPRSLDPELRARLAPRVTPLDATEERSLVYTVAFDLSAFALGFEVGTDHPRVAWSGRIPAAARDARLPGPDGYATLDPLALTGLLDPAWQRATVAVFVGGFRRVHGAFAHGPLSTVNSGSHYGFVQHGVELSRLQPGLATLVTWDDDRVELRTWTEADAARSWRVRHARQNGVPVVEPDPATGEVGPGALIRSWGLGNWSGSAEGELRTVRGGVCVQESDAGRFLLYSYFSNATPSAMAVVYTAYGCSYAMLLDMNALEHTYLSVLVPEDGTLGVHHLVQGMEVLDKVKGADTWPRFVGYADNRDFFYVTRRSAGSAP